MKKFLKALSNFESYVCVFCFVVMACGCFFQVLNRNIFKIPLSWTEELSRFAMIWMALLGSEIGLRQHKQMSVDAVVDRLPGLPRKVVECAGCLINAAFAGVSAVYAVQFVAVTYGSNQISSAMNWPMWIVYLILPLSLALMFAFEVWEFVYILRGRPGAEKGGNQ